VAPFTFPFIKTVSQDQAAPVFESFAESRFYFQSFGAGVNNRRSFGVFLGPEGDKAPEKLPQAVAVMKNNRRHFIRWSYIIAGNNAARNSLNIEDLLKRCYRAILRKSSTHDVLLIRISHEPERCRNSD